MKVGKKHSVAAQELKLLLPRAWIGLDQQTPYNPMVCRSTKVSQASGVYLRAGSDNRLIGSEANLAINNTPWRKNRPKNALQTKTIK